MVNKVVAGQSGSQQLVNTLGIEMLPKTDASVAHKAVERVHQRVANEMCPSIGQAIILSFGVASWLYGDATIADVIKNADQALYAAKEAGRNRVHHSQKPCP